MLGIKVKSLPKSTKIFNRSVMKWENRKALIEDFLAKWIKII